MDKDKIFAFYEKVYFESLADMNIVLSRFPILIAGVALIISSYVFLFNYDYFLWLPGIAIGLITFCIFLAISCLLFCLFRTFRGRKYMLIPSADKIELYRQRVIKQAKNIEKNNQNYPFHKDDEVPFIDEKLQNFIENEFIKCSVHNEAANQDRNKWFHRSMSLIWINLCLCIIIPVSIVIETVWG